MDAAIELGVAVPIGTKSSSYGEAIFNQGTANIHSAASYAFAITKRNCIAQRCDELPADGADRFRSHDGRKFRHELRRCAGHSNGHGARAKSIGPCGSAAATFSKTEFREVRHRTLAATATVYGANVTILA